MGFSTETKHDHPRQPIEWRLRLILYALLPPSCGQPITVMLPVSRRRRMTLAMMTFDFLLRSVWDALENTNSGMSRA